MSTTLDPLAIQLVDPPVLAAFSAVCEHLDTLDGGALEIALPRAEAALEGWPHETSSAPLAYPPQE